MKKSELKSLIKECINESYEEEIRNMLGIKPTEKKSTSSPQEVLNKLHKHVQHMKELARKHGYSVWKYTTNVKESIFNTKAWSNV